MNREGPPRHLDGSVVLDVVGLAEDTLLGLAELARQSGQSLTFHNQVGCPPDVRNRVKQAGGGHVTFVDT